MLHRIVGGIIDWAGRHPYLSTAGILSLFAGGIAANEYVNNKKFSNAVDDGIAKMKSEISAGASGLFGSFGGSQPVPAPVVQVVNESVKAAPVPTATEPFLMYDGIKIIGDEQFQKDNVMWLEFAKKYSPQDYQFIRSNTKWIKSTTIPAAGAGGDGFYWNKSFLRMMIENKNINSGENLKGAVATAAHESGHNSVFNTDRMNETYANIFYHKAWDNLSYVNESELDNFYKNFNFSQLKN